MLNLDKSKWQTVRFGDVVKNANESVRGDHLSEIDTVIALEHLDPGELTIRRYGSAADGTTFTRRVRPGQTLFGKRRAYQRKVAYAEVDAVCSGDILVFNASAERLSPRFLPFLVQSAPFFDHALGTSAGSLSPRTSWKALAAYEFDLPPLDEQDRIADLLWSVEGHKQSLRAIEDSLEMTTGLALAPEGVEYGTVEDFVTKAQSGGTPRRTVPEYYGGSIPWLKSGEVSGNSISETSETITDEALQNSSTWLAPAGSIVVAMYGDGKTRGQVGRLAVPMTTNQAVLALVPNERSCDGDFFYSWMKTRQEHLRWKSAGGAQKNLSKALILSEPFPCMTVKDQVFASRRAMRIESTVKHLDDEQRSLTRLRSSLLADIFGGTA